MDETLMRFYESKNKVECGVWKHPDSPSRKVPRICRSGGQQMLVVFFDHIGFIYHHYVPKGKTINGPYFTEICRQMIYRLKKKRPELYEKGFILHLDNASPHRTVTIKELCAKHNIEILPHPPYSPDEAPSDFYVFPNLKQQLRGYCFENEKALHNACDAALRLMSKDGLEKPFNSLVKRWDLVIKSNGEYFEHEKNLVEKY
jgi:histone-lysine N-methyltransferase SETMAR